MISKAFIGFSLFSLICIHAFAQEIKCKKFCIAYGAPCYTDEDCGLDVFTYKSDSLCTLKINEYLKNRFNEIDTLVLVNASHFVEDVPFKKFTALKCIIFEGNDADKIQTLPANFYEYKNYRSISFVYVCVPRSLINKLKIKYPSAKVVFDNTRLLDCTE
jgi:hypothetical protein